MDVKRIFTILAIDDNQDNLTTLQAVVRDAFPEAKIFTALDGPEGIELARCKDPDTILLDIVMPGMDGFEVCRKLKQDERTRDIPVIFLTALRTDRECRANALEAGAEGFLYKPFDEVELITQIRVMARIRAANRLQRREKEDLAALVAERTRELEQELAKRKDLELEMLHAKEKAEEASKLKTTILSNLSHEFRTPLNGILGIAEILLMKVENPEQRNLVELLTVSGKRLFTTLDAFMKLAQLSAGEFKVTARRISCRSAVEKAVEKFITRAQSKNLPLILDVCQDSEITGDEELIDGILHHLIDNALKFTEQGEVRVIVEQGEKEGNPVALVHVKDTGIGISHEYKDTIFQEFRQLSEGMCRGYEGIGLGLSLAKRMTEVIGGVIDVESSAGQGSTFTVTLPSVPDTPSCPGLSGRAPLPMSGDRPGRELAGHPPALPLVLLVEDNIINQMVTTNYLENVCTVMHAEDGMTALSMARAEHYDAMLIDINLGFGMDGTELAQELRIMEEYRHTPMLALTGYALSGDKEHFLGEGFTHYLPKPFDEVQIVNVVKEMLCCRAHHVPAAGGDTVHPRV